MTLRATIEYRERERFDCVKLARQIAIKDCNSVCFARIMWIVSGLLPIPVCIAAPLPITSLPTHYRDSRPAIVHLKENFTIVSQPQQNQIVVFDIDLIERIEQVQFLPRDNIGIINHYYHSNIISTRTTEPFEDVDTSESDV